MEATSGGNGSPTAAMDKAAAGVHGAVDKLAGAADEAASMVRPAISRAANVAHRAVSKVADVAVPAADWLTDAAENLRKRQQKATDDATHYVSEHPWKSIGFAFVAGLVISRLIR